MNTINASDPLLDYEPSYAWNSTNPQTKQNGSSVSVNFTGTTLQAFGKTKLQSISYSQDSLSTSNYPISAPEKGLNNTILWLSNLGCSNHTVKLIVVNSNSIDQGHSLVIDRFEYTPCSTSSIPLPSPSIPYSPILPPSTPAPQSSSPSTSSALSSSSSSKDTAKTVGIAIGCVLGALVILSAAGLLWRRRRHRMRQKPPSANFLILSSADLPPYLPTSARSKYAPTTDGRALFPAAVVAPSRDEKSELPAPATKPVEGTSGAAYLRGYLPDSKEWLRNAERARAAAAAAAQTAHGGPGGHAAAYEGGIAGGEGGRAGV